VSLMMFSCNEVTGSWHSSGFHGHFRSKSRNDVDNLYRHNAKPPPPKLFFTRSQVRSDKHHFSQHDNRNSHSNGMGDLETHFDMGLGKKKPTTPSQHHKQTKDILSWNNSTKTATTKNERLHETSYNSSFRPTIKRPMTAATNILVHEPVHCRGNPTIHRRRLLSARSFTKNTFRSPPLLAWGASDKTTSSHNFKPCVGDSYHRTIQRTPPEVTIETRTMLTRRNLRAKSAF